MPAIRWVHLDEKTVERIHRARAAGVSLKDLARRFGVADTRIKQVLEGNPNPRRADPEKVRKSGH